MFRRYTIMHTMLMYLIEESARTTKERNGPIRDPRIVQMVRFRVQDLIEGGRGKGYL